MEAFGGCGKVLDLLILGDPGEDMLGMDLLGMENQHAHTESVTLDNQRDVGGDFFSPIPNDQPGTIRFAYVIEGMFGDDGGKLFAEITLVMLQAGKLALFEIGRG
jgi:hypothetical protein